MAALVNFGVLTVSSILFTLFYVWSVSPAALDKKIGEAAYPRCGWYRIIASLFLLVVVANCVLYRWYPLPLPLPERFPWDWTMSAAVAALLAVPALYLMIRGLLDAGEESMRPKKEHCMYAGIYQRIRHPQAAGEVVLWWVIAFLVDSPFLALFSFAYLPVWYYICVAEERDLLLRYGAAYDEYRQRTGFWWPKRQPKVTACTAEGAEGTEGASRRGVWRRRGGTPPVFLKCRFQRWFNSFRNVSADNKGVAGANMARCR